MIKIKKSAVFGLILISSLFLINFICVSFVSAQYYRGSFGGVGGLDLRSGSENIINLVVDITEPFLQVILGGDDYTGLLLFERFLLFMIILAIVYFALSRVPAFEDNRAVIWIITIIIPILSIRYMNFVWINTVLIQYQVLGIAVTALLPFIIYLFFLHSVSGDGVVRKIGWILFIVVYFGLWATNPEQTYGMVYFWTMLIALLVLLADGTIHRAYMNYLIKDKQNLNKYVEIGKLNRDIDEVKALVNNHQMSEREGRKIIKDKEKMKKFYLKMN